MKKNTKNTVIFLILSVLICETFSFSPLCSCKRFVGTAGSQSAQRFESTVIYSSDGDGDFEGEERYQYYGQYNEPEQSERLDPLVESLTRMDEDTANAPTTKLPLLGEVPVDGSLLVLAPVALIAVVGFIMSIQIAFQSKDALVEQMNQVGKVMSSPPTKQADTKDDGCRGLCSDPSQQFDSLKGFMEGLSKKKAIMVEEAAPPVIKPAAKIESVSTPVEPARKSEAVAVVSPLEPAVKSEVVPTTPLKPAVIAATAEAAPAQPAQPAATTEAVPAQPAQPAATTDAISATPAEPAVISEVTPATPVEAVADKPVIVENSAVTNGDDGALAP